MHFYVYVYTYASVSEMIVCQISNLPVSNKRDSKENSCISLGAGWFTIFNFRGIQFQKLQVLRDLLFFQEGFQPCNENGINYYSEAKIEI